MNPTDFARCLSAFLTDYLARQRNASPNTVRSYRDTFVLLLRYLRDMKDIPSEKVSLGTLDAPLVGEFIDHLRSTRKCNSRTCNQRLAAIHAFARYVQTEEPAFMLPMQRVLAIPSKRYKRTPVAYLEVDALGAVLAEPDTSSALGRRDVVLLSVLYDTGARCQELIDLSVKDVRLDAPPHIRLTGKGRKTRIVPLMTNTVALLQEHIEANRLTIRGSDDRPLFPGRNGHKMSRSGIRYVLEKYLRTASKSYPGLPQKAGPHILRHTKAMHMLQAGVPLVIIRDILGHVDIKTTEVYARADLAMKRRALETAAENAPSTVPQKRWSDDRTLMAWLTSL